MFLMLNIFHFNVHLKKIVTQLVHLFQVVLTNFYQPILVDKSSIPIPKISVSCLDCKKCHGYESIKSEQSLEDLTGTSFEMLILLLSMMSESACNSNINNNNKLLMFIVQLLAEYFLIYSQF